jgi:prevent-host-death family protein
LGVVPAGAENRLGRRHSISHIPGVSTATVEQLQKNLASYLAAVEKGDEVLISKGNKPLARLVPVLAPEKDDRGGELTDDWHRLSASGLAAAYGPNEPDYGAGLIRETNPDYRP